MAPSLLVACRAAQRCRHAWHLLSCRPDVGWASGAPASAALSTAASQGHIAYVLQLPTIKQPALPERLGRLGSSLRYASKLTSIPLAQTGEGISECELTSWSVQVGNTPPHGGKVQTQLQPPAAADWQAQACTCMAHLLPSDPDICVDPRARHAPSPLLKRYQPWV
jgi:hypothetical protein